MCTNVGCKLKGGGGGVGTKLDPRKTWKICCKLDDFSKKNAAIS